MNLLPLEKTHLSLVAEWLAREENYQWLDFGNGRQILDVMTLKLMTQRDTNCLRLFTPDVADVPIGVVGLTTIAPNFKSAQLWYVLGDRGYAGQGLATGAVSKLLQIGFRELGLESVNAWAVEENAPSIRVLEKNSFRPAGRLRCCHQLHGVLLDRLLFDLLAAEFQPVGEGEGLSAHRVRP